MKKNGDSLGYYFDHWDCKHIVAAPPASDPVPIPAAQRDPAAGKMLLSMVCTRCERYYMGSGASRPCPYCAGTSTLPASGTDKALPPANGI